MVFEVDATESVNCNCPTTGLFGKDKIELDVVIIENQISTIASRMKTLQGMISQYFIMKGIPSIEFISSINKLKIINNSNKNYYL